MSARSWPTEAAVAFAAFALCSCAIRLPEPEIARRVEVANDAETPVISRADDTRDPDVLVWLTADRLHTGMIFPYDWLLESGFVPPENFGSSRYVNLSWGDRTAYLQKEPLGPLQIVRAMFMPSPSVMELIPVDWDVAEVLPDQRIWRKLVAREHGPRLAAFLNHCTVKDASGRPVVVAPSSWGEGVMLEGRSSYYFPRICNIWSAQTIEACSGEIDIWRAISADGLARQAATPENGFEMIWPGGGRPQSWSLDEQAAGTSAQ